MANTETTVNELKINTLSSSKYASLKASGSLNANELYFVKDDTEGVTSLGSATGDITLGDNLSIENNILTATNTITSINGKSGSILLGTGLTMDGNTINATGGSGSTVDIKVYNGASSASARNMPILLDLLKADNYPDKIKLTGYFNPYSSKTIYFPSITFNKLISQNNKYYIPEEDVDYITGNIEANIFYLGPCVQKPYLYVTDTFVLVQKMRLTSSNLQYEESIYNGASISYDGESWSASNTPIAYRTQPVNYNDWTSDIIANIEFNYSGNTYKRTYHFINNG